MRRLLVSCLAACGAPQAPRAPACTAETKVVLRGQEDVEAAAACRVIASLDLRTGVALDLAPLAALQAIRGELRVGPTVGFIALALPSLEAAGAITIAGNGDLHGVALPKLATAGDIAIESNIALTTLAMPRLAKATAITVQGHAELGLVELSSLATVSGTLRIAGNPKLTLLELGTLARAGAVEIENNGALDASIVDAARSKIAR